MLNGLYGEDNRIRKAYMLGGLALVLLGFLPFALLGEGSVVIAHDQLDGELIAYLLHAKYLGTGISFYPEWMGGVPSTALTPPALFPVLLYKLFSPFTAFILNQLLVAVTAYLGMFFFLNKLLDTKGNWERFVSLTAAVCFAYLPFYSAYGLCVAGIPMLAYGIWRLSEGKGRGLGICLVAYYAVMSSFVLIGYAVVSILWLYAIWVFWKDWRDGKGLKEGRCLLFAAILGLTLYYLGTNFDLVLQVLGRGGGEVSHKQELVLSGLPFWESFWDMLLKGSGHAASLHQWMAVPVAVTLIVLFKSYFRAEGRMGGYYRLLLGSFLTAVLIALFYAFFHSWDVVEIRNRIGGAAVYFQADRIYWFYPFLWYTMCALMLELIWDACAGKMSGSGKRKRIGRILCCCLLTVCVGNVLWQSDFKKNVRQLVNPQTSNAVTWEKFFSPSIFLQIQNSIGEEPSSYRVGCIGLHPSVAAYNGFYTVDGYSNNYPLSYKREFRKVIDKELAKSGRIKKYFDEWGNRCYLFSAELGMNYYVDKVLCKSIQRLELDTAQLKALNCDYLFSSVPIVNSEELGLSLKGVYSWNRGDYDVYVYWLDEHSKEGL